MKIAGMTVSCAASLAMALALLVPATPAAAQRAGFDSGKLEISAAKKKKAKLKRQYRREAPRRFQSRFPPGDPSYGIEELEYRRARGECLIDLGYGRFESCHTGGAL